MSEGYLRRLDLAYPKLPNPRAIYAVHMIENKKLDDLEDEVNDYLFNLPSLPDSYRWEPHLIDTQLLLNNEKGNKARYIMKITLYAVGTIVSSPT